MFQWRLKVVLSILTKTLTNSPRVWKHYSAPPWCHWCLYTLPAWSTSTWENQTIALCQQKTAAFLKSRTVNDQIKSQNFFQTVKFKKKKKKISSVSTPVDLIIFLNQLASLWLASFWLNLLNLPKSQLPLVSDVWSNLASASHLDLELDSLSHCGLKLAQQDGDG